MEPQWMEQGSKRLILLVGAEGFEPPASCSQSRRATRLRHAPNRRALLILDHYWRAIEKVTARQHRQVTTRVN